MVGADMGAVIAAEKEGKPKVRFMSAAIPEATAGLWRPTCGPIQTANLQTTGRFKVTLTLSRVSRGRILRIPEEQFLEATGPAKEVSIPTPVKPKPE
jgi:hypothetical protein